MAGSLSGVASQQQAPIQNTFQPGGTAQQARIQEREQEERQVNRTTTVESGQSARADTQRDEQREAVQSRRDDSIQFTASQQGRGSVVDLTV